MRQGPSKEQPRCQFHWTDEAVERLIHLTYTERITASQAAAILNKEFPCRTKLSRSAVLGKIFRLLRNATDEQS